MEAWLTNMNEGFSWQNLLDRASDVGASYLTARNQPKPAPVAVPRTEAPPPYLKWALIGGAGLAVLAVIVTLFKKGK